MKPTRSRCRSQSHLQIQHSEIFPWTAACCVYAGWRYRNSAERTMNFPRRMPSSMKQCRKYAQMNKPNIEPSMPLFRWWEEFIMGHERITDLLLSPWSCFRVDSSIHRMTLAQVSWMKYSFLILSFFRLYRALGWIWRSERREIRGCGARDITGCRLRR